jgi:ABC-2 type transport system ATP-binding protein
LLDEPTSAVDPQSRRDFWDSLFRLVGEGTTILVSTHYMDEAERCHRVAILDRGRLAAEGAPRDLALAIDATVLEVACERPHRALHSLADAPEVASATQLGARLHVLIERSVGSPVEAVRSRLVDAGIDAGVEETEATLEDVFVVATRAGREHHR